MKLQQIFLATALAVSAAGFAQKDEMKTLKKLFANEQPGVKDVADYKAAVAKAEPLIATAAEADKVYFEMYKAMTPIYEVSVPANAQNQQFVANVFTIDKINSIVASANAVRQFEAKPGSKKVYTDEIDKKVKYYKPYMLNYAIALGNEKKYKEASAVLYSIYELDKKDADNLYYAASYAVNGQDQESAMKYYRELYNMKFTGEKTIYTARNKASEKYEPFEDKTQRDNAVKIGTHSLPKDEQEPSKQPEIYANMAKILMNQKKTDEAKAIVKEGLAAMPNDVTLKQLESELVLSGNSYDEYKKVANQSDVDAVYNLGVLAMQENKAAEAEAHFQRAIEMKPDYTNAYLNLASVKLKADKSLVEQMNKLGTSAPEQKKYEQLKSQRVALFKSVLPTLEKAYALDPKNDGVIDNLISVYGYLEMKEKRAAVKSAAGR